MDAVTYPDDDVIDLLTSSFACYKPPIADNQALASSYGVKWTPGLVWLTPDGEQVHDNVGYFAPTELMAEATYAQGQGAVRAGDWKQALENFESVTARWPESFAAPAAQYWAGVAGKMKADDSAPLLAKWKQLLKSYPDSAWAMKVKFIED